MIRIMRVERLSGLLMASPTISQGDATYTVKRTWALEEMVLWIPTLVMAI